MNRDLRIDFLRGIVLLWIVADHVYNNETQWFVSADWVFFDCAAAFVFMSGLVCGMVYSRTLDRSGWLATQGKALKRCAQLYIAQMALFCIVVAMVWVARHWQPMTPAFLLEPLFDNPRAAAPRAVLMIYSPWLIDILKLYMGLLLVLPSALWLYRRSRVALIIASFTLYAMAHHYDWFTPTQYPTGKSWFWNPFAWQVLFLGAAALGLERARGFRIPRTPALITLAACLMGVVMYLANRHLLGDRWTDRPSLGAAHIVSFAVFAYLLSTILKPDWRFWSSWMARPLINCGRHSLLVFCCGVVVSYAMTIALYPITNRLAEGLIIAAGVGVTLASGSLFEWLSSRRAAAREAGRAAAAATPAAPPEPVSAALPVPVVLEPALRHASPLAAPVMLSSGLTPMSVASPGPAVPV